MSFLLNVKLENRHDNFYFLTSLNSNPIVYLLNMKNCFLADFMPIAKKDMRFKLFSFIISLSKTHNKRGIILSTFH